MTACHCNVLINVTVCTFGIVLHHLNHKTMAAAKRRKLLPKSLCAIPCMDKDFHEEWTPDRDMLNFPHPFRAVFTGPPNTGKSTCVKNIVIRADPPFQEVVIIHADPENSREYDDLGDGVRLIKNIPKPDEWVTDGKTLVVIDDIELKELPKEQRRALDRLVGYVSTHKDISVCVCTQDWFNLPPIVRRCSNVWVIWKSPDARNMKAIGNRIGMPDFPEIAKQLLPAFRDSLWIDQTDKSPFPIRRNGFETINKIE